MSAPAPGSPDWLKLVTASKASAVLGLSPWESPRSLWHRMRGELPRDEGNTSTRRGQYLESGILAWWEDQHPEVIHHTVIEQYYATRPDMPWAAATLDAVADDLHGNTIVVEVKTAARGDEWGQPGTDEIPAYYAAQVLFQLGMVPEAAFANVAVLLGPGLEFREYVIQRDQELIDDILKRCHEFHLSLDSDEPPDLDDSVATYDAIRSLHPDIEPDLTVELTPEQADEYLDAGDAAKAAVKRERLAKTVVLDALGRAQYGACNGLRVARRQPSKYGVSLNTATKIRTIKQGTGTS